MGRLVNTTGGCSGRGADIVCKRHRPAQAEREMIAVRPHQELGGLARRLVGAVGNALEGIARE